MSKLTNEHTFTQVLDPFYMGTVYPVIVTKDNGDGTFQGKFDLDKNESSQKDNCAYRLTQLLYMLVIGIFIYSILRNIRIIL